jgi:hypothetical protein
MNKNEYRVYLRSPHWQRRRERIAAASNQCEFRPCDDSRPDKGPFYGARCNETSGLEVHHRHYDSLGTEEDDDLEVLCRVHHLVRTVERVECDRCAESVVPHECDAVDLVEAAIECSGTKDLTLDKVDPPGLCDYCDHVLNDD